MFLPAREHRGLVFSPLLAALCVASGACEKDGGGEISPDPASSLRLVIYSLSEEPTGSRAIQQEIADLKARSDSAALPGTYQRLLDELRESWGQESPRLAPYHYNLCLALKLAGRRQEGLREIREGVDLWPRSFQHRLLEATERMEFSRGSRRLIDGTEEAVELVLRLEYRPLLERMRVRLSDLHLEWASVLYQVRRPQEALDELETAMRLGLSPAKASTLKARILVQLRRGDEAAPLLQELRARGDDSPDIALALGSILLDSGDVEAAWEVLDGGLARSRAPGDGARPSATVLARLQTKGAAALNRLGRVAEARDLVLERLETDPDDDTGLFQLATSLRGLQLAEARDAVLRRYRELAPYVHLMGEVNKFRQIGETPTAWYNQARAFETIHRPGDALRAVDLGLRLAPVARALHLLKVEIYLELGRLPRALRAAEGALEASDSAVFRLSRARVLVRLGRTSEAREIVQSLAAPPASEGEPDRALRLAYRARALVELGDLDELAEYVESPGEPPEGSVPEAVEIRRLCRAELLIAGSRFGAALDLLRERTGALEGGETWAGALRMVAAAAAGDREPSHEVDVSDLLDHQSLRERSLSLPSFRGQGKARDLLERARRLSRQSDRLLAAMKDFGDRDVVSSWRSLYRIYVQGGAGRKARETAWYLWRLNPSGADENLLLGRALSRREEVLSRLAAASRGLARRPGDEELLEIRRAAREVLGVSR